MATQQSPLLVLGIENPLLDTSVDVTSEFLDKHKQKVGTQSLATDVDRPLFEEIVTLPGVKYIAGGACQNSIRGVQWLTGVPGLTHFVGCIGKDDNGKKLTEVATGDGVNVHYYLSEKFRTGTCAVLIHNRERGLIADLAAANDYQHSHFETPEIQALVAKVGIVYTTGYFITVSPKTIIELAKHCAANNKWFVFSIAAPFVVQFYWDHLKEIISYSDLVVCNENEADAFLEKAGLPRSDLKEGAKLVGELPKVNTQRKRIVIFTQGKDPAIVYNDGQVKEFPVLPANKSEIVDTNGAGDAFAGGILAGLALGKPFEECMRAAMFAAHKIIHVSGTQYPPTCDFNWK